MSLPPKIVMASSNAGKIREIARILSDLNVEIVPQSDFGIPDAIEDGSSFAENSVIKARHAARLSGLPAIADDSGLSVDALDGRPGIFSARYAGESASDDDNVDKLLEEMHGQENRAAAFHCVASFVLDAEAEPILGEGAWHGEILHERRGDGGFGYDPVFLDPESGVASAELTQEQKNARSHRGQALRKLADQLRAVAT